ncbi:MAG: hypothetical protein JWR75_1741 [Devosia sp.]|nr:hypothetical protein [Devosia sp.]
MCAAYRDTDLAGACLALQQAFSVDVPLLLVLSLADRASYGLAPDTIAALESGARTWRDTVIVPLRQTRQVMKYRFTAPAEVAFREDIKRAELKAEHLHVLRLAKLVPAPLAAMPSAARHYLAACGLTHAAADDFIETFASAYAAQIERVEHE